MPFSKTNVLAAGEAYPNPFVGPINHTARVVIDPSNFATGEVDAKGYLKPGTPLAADGTLVGLGEAVYGCVVEATKVAASDSAADRNAAANAPIVVALFATVNQDLVEDILGRVLTADEIAGFDLAGSTTKLL